MENAQLIGLSRQVALRRQMDVVANNMANINTAGFKKESILFEQYLMPVASDNDFKGMDRQLSFTEDWATVHDMTGGPIKQTGNALDIALQGDGFLAVQTPGGVRYTRDGQLKLDNNGMLVTSNGNPVLSEGGPVSFSPEETGITFASDGAIMSSAGQKGRLQIVAFQSPQALKHEGDNLFSGGTPIADNGGTEVVQGAVEGSNVSGVTEMANMIRVNRAYESIANIMKRQDELRTTAVQKLGSLQA